MSTTRERLWRIAGGVGRGICASSAHFLEGPASRAGLRCRSARGSCLVAAAGRVGIAVGLILVGGGLAAAADDKPAAREEKPPANAERLQWWRDARFGMFIHWGPVSLKGTEIGWSRGREVPIPVYDNLYKEFNPVRFDAKEYVALAKEAGTSTPCSAGSTRT
jgi:hypothetical protein